MSQILSIESADAVGSSKFRRSAAENASATELPSPDAEEWRYSPVADLDLAELRASTVAPSAEVDDLQDLVPERAATVTVVDGWVVGVEVAPGWAAKGLVVESNSEPNRMALTSETVFDHWHRAISPSAVQISAPDGLVVSEPVVVVNHHQGNSVVAFPHVQVAAGVDSEIAVLEHQSSLGGTGLTVPLVELAAAESSRLTYLTIQNLNQDSWEIGRQLSTVGERANLSSGIAAFGGSYSRVQTDCHLAGRGAKGELLAIYYGDGEQLHDFRTFQHHDAPSTRSDLLFKGALDDKSGSVYTGLIHIHPEGAGSDAYQTNRNIKLNEDAWAWSVPNLEIENNDVRCSHASTVAPIDIDQQFYLHSRGVPPVAADRLIVAGFFDEVVSRFRLGNAPEEIVRLINEKLDRRQAK